MAQMNISNTLWNDTQAGIIAYVEQLKDRLLKDYIATLPSKDKGRIPADIKAEVGVLQERLNEFFIKHWVDYQSFLLDEGVDPETIDSWHEVQEFLKGLPDDEAMWLKNQIARLDNRINNIDIPDGGAFDISTYNSTEQGVLAQYATLSDAILAIPSDHKKSGMSIRYLSSYTEQYEQFRYMYKYEDTTAGNASFNDPDNWRGVDFYPEEDSENLVRSGGIYEWATEVGEIVDVSSDDWEPTTAEQRFEQVQREIRDLNAVVNTEQLRIGAVQIDALPVEGSGHAVSSGGVYTAIDTLKTEKDTEISELNDALQGEISLREQEVAQEKQRAMLAETVNTNKINALEQKVDYNENDIEAKVTHLTNTVNNNKSNIESRVLSLEFKENQDIAAVIADTDTKIANLVDSAPQDYNTLGKLTVKITEENSRAQTAEGTLDGKINTINSKIPSAASSSNPLADRAFVNSSMATATATHRGTYNLITDLGLTISATREQIANSIVVKLTEESIVADNNDYTFIQIPNSNTKPEEILRVERYKYNGANWGYEYTLNNSSFTSDQWAAINSGINTTKVSEFTAKYDKPSSGIPKSDLSSSVQTSLGKADTALQDHQSLADYSEVGEIVETID